MVQPILSQDDLLDHDILGTPTDALQQVLRQALHGLMELDIAQRTGAERYERSEARRDQRNGTRPPRRFDTRMGSIDLEIPRLRRSNYMPPFLEAHSRGERALMVLVQEAVIGGVSNRKIEKLARALGITSLSKSQVSEFMKELDEEARAFRERPLTAHRYP
jgi:transposase-like protein